MTIEPVRYAAVRMPLVLGRQDAYIGGARTGCQGFSPQFPTDTPSDHKRSRGAQSTSWPSASARDGRVKPGHDGSETVARISAVLGIPVPTSAEAPHAK